MNKRWLYLHEITSNSGPKLVSDVFESSIQSSTSVSWRNVHGRRLPPKVVLVYNLYYTLLFKNKSSRQSHYHLHFPRCVIVLKFSLNFQVDLPLSFCKNQVSPGVFMDFKTLQKFQFHRRGARVRTILAEYCSSRVTGGTSRRRGKVGLGWVERRDVGRWKDTPGNLKRTDRT